MHIFRISKNQKLKLAFTGMFFSVLFSANAVDKNIVGIVRDAQSKDPINAAQISLLNEKVSATTNEKGQFSIKSDSKGTLIQVKAFNYAVREISLRGKDSIIIELYPDGFTSILNQGLTGASIEKMNVLEKSTSLSPDDEIGLKMLGNVRSISRSASTAIGSAMFVRGINSLVANSQPLFIVDGTIRNNLVNIGSIHDGFYSNPLANIEMSDIESVELLKDGTAIYGAKGANGVVIIKTKRGNGMATKIDLNISTGLTTIPNTIPVMGADDYKIYISEMLGSTGMSNTEIEQLPYLSENPLRYTYNVYHNNTDWKKEVYKQALTQNYNINVNGGDEKALYYFSLGYAGNQGQIKETDFQRYNMRLNADIQLNKSIQMGINTGFSRIDRNMRDDGVNAITSPSWMSLIKAPILSPYNFTYLGESTSELAYYDLFNIGNPVAIQTFSINTSKQNGFNISLIPQIKITDEIQLMNQFDYSVNKVNEDSYRPYMYSAPVLIAGLGESYNTRSSYVYRNNIVNNNLKLSYRKQLDQNQLLKAEIGNRFISEIIESSYVVGHNSMSNSVINLRGSFKFLGTGGQNLNSVNISNYALIDYSLDNKYFLKAAASMDASSKFGKETLGGVQIIGNTWALFPSIDASWIVSSETFMQNARFIDLLKVRAGYQITGNDDIPYYQANSYFSSIRFKGVANGMVISNLANPQIQWESTSDLHAGLDLGLFNERLLISADVYSKNTENLLTIKKLPEYTGLDYYWTNDGSMTNVGGEISMKVKALNLKNFNWELGLTAGHYKNQITALQNNQNVIEYADAQIINKIGEAAGSFYGFSTNGVYATEDEANMAGLSTYNKEGELVAFGPGDMIFEDLSGPEGVADGIIDDYDRKIIGNPNPDLYGSFYSSWSIGRLNLTANFTYSYGNDVYNYARRMLESGMDLSNQSPAILNRWTADGQNTSIPRAVFGDELGNARFSDRWIEDGSYLKLKRISASYDIPVNATMLSGINLWIAADNLMTWSKYLGPDPEFSSSNNVVLQGIDMGLLPLSKSFFVGVKLSL